MNYYDNIKNKLIDNEITKRVKNYSINKSDLNTYYEVGKLLSQAGKHYGEGIIKEYSIKLTNDLGKKYNERTLRRMRQFYELFSKEKWSTVSTNLTWSHYVELLKINNNTIINYYINISIKYNLSIRELRSRIKSKEYERLDNKTKNKLINQEETTINDFIKNPIIIKNKYDTFDISEKMLKELILEDISSFMKELGDGYSFIDSEYKIKIGNNYNYIDLLVYNIEYNCYVVVELKITELKKEHIGQIEIYMNYIDQNIKSIEEDKTIGIIIVKEDNQFIIGYSSDKKIISREYQLV